MSFSATPTYQILEFNSTHNMNVPQASSILTHSAIDPVVRLLDRIAGLDSTTFGQCMGLNILCNEPALSGKSGPVDEPGLEIRLSSMDASSIVTFKPDTGDSLKRIISFNQRFTTLFENNNILQENRATYLHIVKSAHELVRSLVTTNKNQNNDWEVNLLGGRLRPCHLPNRPYEDPLLLMVMSDKTEKQQAGAYTLYEVPNDFIAQQIEDIAAWVNNKGEQTGDFPLAAVPLNMLYQQPADKEKKKRKLNLTATEGPMRSPRTRGESGAGCKERHVLTKHSGESEEEGTISGDASESGPDEEEYEMLVQMGQAMTAEQRKWRKAGRKF